MKSSEFLSGKKIKKVTVGHNMAFFEFTDGTGYSLGKSKHDGMSAIYRQADGIALPLERDVGRSPLEVLAEQLTDLFPEAEVIFRKSDDPQGFQHLNIIYDSTEVAIEWKPDTDYGLSSYDNPLDLDGLFDSSQEQYCNLQELYQRVLSLMFLKIMSHGGKMELKKQ